MTEKCFDEGTIQAFLDGELDTDLLENVARHTAACANCSLLLQQVEDESAFAFSALDNEFNTLVPTERIRTGLYDAIAQIEQPQKSIWARIFGEGFSFSNPSIVAFASLLLVVGLFTVLFINREDQSTAGNETARFEPKETIGSPVEIKPIVIEQAAQGVQDEVASVDDTNKSLKVRKPVYKPSVEVQSTIQKANFKTEKSSVGKIRPRDDVKSAFEQQTDNETLLGEGSYVQTIATLNDSLKNRKDQILRPSERVAFERELAVVDDVIAKMQKEVRRNPKNEAAKQVLRSSYENKIDLLNSVAEKSELMATAR